jgi:hypothetical protein
MKNLQIFFSIILLIAFLSAPITKAQSYPYDIGDFTPTPTPTPTFSSTTNTAPSPTPALEQTAKEINTGPESLTLVAALAGLLAVLLRRKVFK